VDRRPAARGSTVGLDPAELRRAAVACAELLAEYEQRPFGDFVLARLRESAPRA
jgi:hypothetical protein